MQVEGGYILTPWGPRLASSHAGPLGPRLASSHAGRTGTAASEHAAPRGDWQAEMDSWLALYDAKQAPFSHVPPVEGRPAEPTDAARVRQERDGAILRHGDVLKPDQFPGMHSERVTGPGQPRIQGAPNYRPLAAMSDGPPRVHEGTIHGVAQPSVDGIRSVVAQAGASAANPALWTNLREEPCVYVNGRPFNVRVESNPTVNKAFPGASVGDVEAMEEQLKNDVLREAMRNGGRVLVHDENADGRLQPVWETLQSVQTTREVFDGLEAEGCPVDYARIPMTDEKRPEDRDVDALVQRMAGAGVDQPAIFNCHQGRGRTITAMAAAGIVRHAQVDGTPGPITGLKTVRAAIDKAAEDFRTATTPEARKEALESERTHLERYALLESLDAYAREQAPQGFGESFSAWRERHPLSMGPSLAA